MASFLHKKHAFPWDADIIIAVPAVPEARTNAYIIIRADHLKAINLRRGMCSKPSLLRITMPFGDSIIYTNIGTK